MMTTEQANIVKMVYSRFIESEDSGAWGDLDENLAWFDILSDEELVRESEIKLSSHSKGTFRCQNTHDRVHCFAPYILEGVEAILNLYENTKELPIKNRYVLQYYLAMSELRMIYSD